jgi:phosphoglycolate phosphatase
LQRYRTKDSDRVYPALLSFFDLDGALIETAPDLVATPNIILTREGLSPRAYEAARNLIGGGAKAMIA